MKDKEQVKEQKGSREQEAETQTKRTKVWEPQESFDGDLVAPFHPVKVPCSGQVVSLDGVS